MFLVAFYLIINLFNNLLLGTSHTVGSVVKNPPGDTGEAGLVPGWGSSPTEGKRQPTPVFLPGKSHGQRSLAGYSPWGHDLATKQQQLHTRHWRYNIEQNQPGS